MKKRRRKENVIAVILFGSTVKKENKPLSDIDVAVIIENPSLEDEAEIGASIQRKLI